MSFSNLDNNFENLPYRGIAFEGGGVTCLGHVGVLRYLEKIGVYYKLTHFSGSSAGSMIAALSACRIPPGKIQEIILQLNFQDLEDGSWLILQNAYRLAKTYGWNRGEAMKYIFAQNLETYVGNAHITLGQILEKYGSTLVITGTEVTLKKTHYFTPETHPELELVEAIRISGGFPLAYPPVSKGLDLYIDGGLLNNYPIRKLYDYLPQEQVLGSKLVSTSDVLRERIVPQDLIHYIKILIEILHSQNLKVHVEDEDWLRTIKVDIGNVTPLDFDICSDQKLRLISAGENAAENFFK